MKKYRKLKTFLHVKYLNLSVTQSVTQVVAIGGVLVLLPADLAIPILVVVLPVFVDVLLDVPPLPVFDPVAQLGMADEAVLISVNTVNNLPVGSTGHQGTLGQKYPETSILFFYPFTSWYQK